MQLDNAAWWNSSVCVAQSELYLFIFNFYIFSIGSLGLCNLLDFTSLFIVFSWQVDEYK